jgi:hypothetical protein
VESRICISNKFNANANWQQFEKCCLNPAAWFNNKSRNTWIYVVWLLRVDSCIKSMGLQSYLKTWPSLETDTLSWSYEVIRGREMSLITVGGKCLHLAHNYDLFCPFRVIIHISTQRTGILYLVIHIQGWKDNLLVHKTVRRKLLGLN